MKKIKYITRKGLSFSDRTWIASNLIATQHAVRHLISNNFIGIKGYQSLT